MVRLLFLLLVGFLSLAGAQPDPGELEEPEQYTIDEIMEAIRDEQGVDRDEQLEPHAVDPGLLEMLGDALLHKWVIIASLRATVEDVARRLTGSSPRRQHIQLGLSYVSSKVMGILALFEGAGEAGSKELIEPGGGGDEEGGGGGGEIGEGGGEEGEGEEGKEGEGEGEEGEGEEGEGGGSGGLGGRGGGLAGIERNRSGGAASQSGEGGALAGRGGSASGGASSGGTARGGYSGSSGSRSGSAGRMSLAERRAAAGTRSRGTGRSGYSSGSGGVGGPVGHLATADQEYGSEDRTRYRGGSGSGSAGSGRLSADEEGGSSARGSRGSSGRRSSGSTSGTGSPLGEILGETRNLSWVVVIIALAVIGTLIATTVRVVRFFKRVKKGRQPAVQPVTIRVEDSALRILKERFARDEITRAEFEEKRRHLDELSRTGDEPEPPESKKRQPVAEDVGGDILAP